VIGGRGRPNEAKLQLALLPSITGLGSAQALLAASGSRKVTYTLQFHGDKTEIKSLYGNNNKKCKHTSLCDITNLISHKITITK
jgi:hypothetical protein